MSAAPRWVLAIAMCVVGVLHFANPEPFVRIVPDYLPAHLTLVYVSGFFEVLGGVGLLIERVRRAAAWGLIALYVCVFPANVYMAMHHVPMGDHALPDWAAWGRLPFQIVLIAWAWRYTRVKTG